MYGIGAILGAGIYALLGEISKVSGSMMPLTFLVAGSIAGLTAYSYCQLIRIFPKSGGEAEFVYRSFSSTILSQIIAWLVAFTGIVSAATLTQSFIGYLEVLLPVPDFLTALVLILMLTGVACIGIGESAWLVAVITCIELSGLLLIAITSHHDFFQALPQQLNDLFRFNWNDLKPMMLGAFLAFYAFIGFEDIVNLAEETQKPKRNIPLAITTALITCTFIYVIISLIALASLPLEKLQSSQAPLVDVYKQQGGNPDLLSAIGMFAIVNGLLAQIIMASRILYGARHSINIFKNFSKINNKTKTPVVATLFVSTFVLFFIFLFPLGALAVLTSFVILMVFCFINLSLVVITWRTKNPRKRNFFIPTVAFIVNLIFLYFKFSYNVT